MNILPRLNKIYTLLPTTKNISINDFTFLMCDWSFPSLSPIDDDYDDVDDDTVQDDWASDR